MKKLSIIIINYATKDLIEKCINNLLNSYDNLEIIFVDNDSPDGSYDLAQKLYENNPKVILIRTQNNGLAAGFNLGLEKASANYILYLGTDSFPTGDALEKLITYMDLHPEVGIATPKLLLRDGSVDIDAHRGFPTPWVAFCHLTYLDHIFPKSKFFNGYSMQYLDLSTEHEIDACISHFMMVNPKVHNKIGKWDESYFLYGEDIDFCYRAKQAGFIIMYLGDIEVLHYKGASVNRNTSADIKNTLNTNYDSISFKGKTVESKNVINTSFWMRLRIAQESSRAMKIFYQKHFINKYPKFLTTLIFIGIWLNDQIKSLKVFLKYYL